MDHFQRQGGELFAEGVPLSAIAARFGTPTYVYSLATLTRHVQALAQGLAGLDHLLCYAVKASGNIALLEILASLGCGFDAVSGGELARVLAAGGDPRRTIASGVGLRDDEIDWALTAGVLYISVESEAELEAVAARAAHHGGRARVSVRVNPDVDAETHPHIATGLKQNKFGVPIARAGALYARARALPSLEMIGVGCHIGSQITRVEPFVDAARRTLALARELKGAGSPLTYLGVGGGLGVTYTSERPPSPDAYGAALAGELAGSGMKVVLEPGRVIVANAGVLLTRVVRVKQGQERAFVILDAGMNDLIRPALYGAKHGIEPVATAGGLLRADVVGPVCESADTFARDLELPALAAGDLVAIRGAGAYGFSMSSTYNGRPRPAEVLCDGDEARIIRERDRVEELWRGERHLDGTPVAARLPGPLGSWLISAACFR